MDIKKPFERELPLFAPEITEKKIQRKGKKRDSDDDINIRGKIHSQKYLNYSRTVKLQGQPINGSFSGNYFPSLEGRGLRGGCPMKPHPYLLIFF